MRDAVVPGGFVGPAPGFAIGSQGLDVGELIDDCVVRQRDNEREKLYR
jgi:hypothetical protein